MNKETLKIQRKLKEESIALRQKALNTPDYIEGTKIREEQDKVYKKWLFFKKLNSVSKKEQK